MISLEQGQDPVIAIRIVDQGPGVPEQDIDHIFEPFYRVDRARNRNTGGYGIGLAIVQRVITRHAGQVKASNTDSGLCVRVTLPALAIQGMINRLRCHSREVIYRSCGAIIDRTPKAK